MILHILASVLTLYVVCLEEKTCCWDDGMKMDFKKLERENMNWKDIIEFLLCCKGLILVCGSVFFGHCVNKKDICLRDWSLIVLRA
jgi:hypothetical protein